jgi:hypothetical protein
MNDTLKQQVYSDNYLIVLDGDFLLQLSA